VLEVDSTLALEGGADGDELEVHLIGSVLSAYDLVSSTLHVIQLAGEDRGEATLDVVRVGRVESELPCSSIVFGNIKE